MESTPYLETEFQHSASEGKEKGMKPREIDWSKRIQDNCEEGGGLKLVSSNIEERRLEGSAERGVKGGTAVGVNFTKLGT